MATTTRQLADFIVEGGVQDIAVQQNPHIQPGTLQPAVAGKLLDGTTNHSGAYGTAQSDGHSYYYTDIKGSKPIKDPRIGAHFGSQRHKFRSLQILEQETATHGEDVYSIDGRESCRMVNVATTGNMVLNDDHGLRLKNNGQNQDGEFYEIVSYFNDMNVLVKTYADSDHRVKFSLNGAAYGSNVSGLPATVHSPLGGRYVDASSVVNLAVGATLGINTVKINTGTEVYGIELITQDTGSTVRKQHVNIPAQTVVSYGKKFSIGSDTLTNAVHKHHNPFAFKTDGSTAWASGAHNGTSWPVGTGSSHNIDTATSLGLSNWLHSSNYYKPYNGGRVVIWVDSDGTIKTSVTVMPPNAQNVSGSAISAKANASIANNTPVPTFSGTIDHSLSEVAKTFHWTEFGNGAANGGTGASHADVSMLSISWDNIAYVMDDGLTSYNGHDMRNNGMNPDLNGSGSYVHFTFIGTGFTTRGSGGAEHIARNLPYGTHILKFQDSDIDVDGVEVHTNLNIMDNTNKATDYTFYQPKKPPVPDDACIIADYMLMAEFVVQGTTGIEYISKGVRSNSVSRDVWVDGSAFSTMTPNNAQVHGLRLDSSSAASGATDIIIKLPSFGTQYLGRGYDMSGRHQLYVDGTSAPQTAIGSGNGSATYMDPGTAKILGTYDFQINTKNGSYTNVTAIEVVTPIHTSSHYQTFETPFQHELVGGDRNMEQTNLVVTSDGKTWDEVTRDTSYMSPSTALVGTRNGGHVSSDNPCIFDECRGIQSNKPCFNKNIAYGYDRFNILEEGLYRVQLGFYNNPQDTVVYILKNSTSDDVAYGTLGRADSTDDTTHIEAVWEMKRGDYIYTRVRHGGSNAMSGGNAGYTLMSIQKLN